MDQGFLKYLIETKRIRRDIVANIEATFGRDADYETENKINDIIELLEECDLDPNIYLAQYPSLLELAKIEDREELKQVLEYVKEYYGKNKKSKNPYLLIHIILAAKQIIENEKKEQTEQIIALLKREGLMRIFEPKTNKSKAKVEQILYSDYGIVSRNIRILKKEKSYKELVYSNPLILIIEDEKELRKVLEEYQEKNKKEDEEKQKGKEKEEENFADEEEQEEDSQEIENEHENDNDNEEQQNHERKLDDNQEPIQEEKTISGHTISLQEKRLLELGDEQDVLPVLEAFNKYGVSYEILSANPDILRRSKIYNIPEIIELLYKNGIPYSVIYDCPEILKECKADDIADIIEELKVRNISLTILITCPEILVNSSADKIKETIIELENNNIDKYIVYSMPEIFISNDIEKYIEEVNNIDDDLKKDMEKINDILPNYHIVFEEIDENIEKNGLDEQQRENIKQLKHNENILVVSSIYNASSILDTLEKQGIDTEVVLSQPKILNLSKEKVDKVIDSFRREKLGFGILIKDPMILVKVNDKRIEEIIECIERYNPKGAKKVIKALPSILYKGNSKNIQLVLEQLKENSIDIQIIEKAPQILLRNDYEEIGKVITKLNERGFEKEEICSIPEILVLGKEKYIDRNIEIFKRNEIDIPLHLVHCLPARNNARNIDVLIENNLERYIPKNPEILQMQNARLVQMLQIAKDNNINVLKTVKNKQTNEKEVVLNMAYFKLNDSQINANFDLDMKYIREVGIEANNQEKKQRKIKNTKLYDAIYPILDKHANEELKQYVMDNISYTNNGKRISKQRVIREAYVELESKVAKQGKKVIKEVDVTKLLSRKLNNLTKAKVKETKTERGGGRSEKV